MTDITGAQRPALVESRGWDDVSDTYGVKAIPQSFLLDPNGTIIGKNLVIEALTTTLDRVLAEGHDCWLRKWADTPPFTKCDSCILQNVHQMGC